ncbi:hypothetical protein COV16_04320 [Candidatus Woesearchaeota archaeon CG10_big_fil_rev_8_21_14_0_10_34_8]|nr:MAG: hypothetical protein COV16_04320 [Candidatus Woesearchaeota archaeon CG10_big_fil_rev_8_21_14_0_10_34_8]
MHGIKYLSYLCLDLIMDNKLYKEIFYIHQNYIKNFNTKNKKIFVCFSGVPGSGKTYISKVLEKKYSAIRINTDILRDILMKLMEDHPDFQNKDRESLLEYYLHAFFQDYNFLNGFIILDASIDRRYDKLCPLLETNGFIIFVIQVESSLENIKRRLYISKKEKADLFIGNLEVWQRDYEEYGNKHKVDITVKNNDFVDFSPIFEAIDVKLRL